MTDIPEDIMREAVKCAETVLRNLPDDCGDVTTEINAIARALLAAENRGAERALRVLVEIFEGRAAIRRGEG